MTWRELGKNDPRGPATHSPSRKRKAAWLVLTTMAGTLLRGETWQTTTGDRVEGKLSAVYGPIAVVTTKGGSAIFPLEKMGDAELGRVADFLATRPAKAATWKETTSPVGKALRNRLQVLRNGKLAAFDPGAKAEPEFYLAYFGAYWCGPCRRFSPGFVKTYERLQQLAPGRFEVVFISSDNDSDEMLKYMREVGMPWPVLRYSQVGNVSILERFKGSGIPCVVAVTREGDLLYHSYRGEEYLGPEFVLQNFESLLRAMNIESVAGKRSLHRLAVVQHLRATAGDSAPKPYLIGIDYRRYHTLEEKNLLATLEIDEAGHVASAAFEPKLPVVLDTQLVSDAEQWLFLPAAHEGRAVRRKVQLPLKLE